MIVQHGATRPPARLVVREVWHVRAYGWPYRYDRAGRRRKPSVYPVRVQTVCEGYGKLAEVVLWLETMGYRCRVTRLRLGSS